jgi:hydrogenase maturation protein HypF
LCFAAAGADEPAYSFELDRTEAPWQIDLRPAVREIVADVASRVAPSVIADRFHATLVAAGAAAIEAAWPLLRERAPLGRPRVALSGGCFQSPLLVEGFERRLGPSCELLRPAELPAGDGGLAFGQALVADARVAAELEAVTGLEADATAPRRHAPKREEEEG